MAFQSALKGTISRLVPEDSRAIQNRHTDLLDGLVKQGVVLGSGVVDVKQLSAIILEFKKLIEEDPNMLKDFRDMFDQVPRDQGANKRSITNYMELLAVLHKTITMAPTDNFANPHASGVPMYGVLASFCNTSAGRRAFTNTKANAIFHKVFDQWTKFLEERLGMPFSQAWVCDPEQPHMGFASWDDFFTRRFREGVRPVFSPDKPEFINNPCEATIQRVVSSVKATDEFLIKDMSYSFNQVLGQDPLASELVGGTAFQGVVGSLDYHRWHSPIDGRVVKTRVVPGTHFATGPDTGSDPEVVSNSEPSVTAVSTRALIFIESDNPAIGLMCFVGVGLGEVSTATVEVKEGDRVKKGDELGSFHFGGSTHLLVFRPETNLTLSFPDETPAEGQTHWVNSALI